jgi:hypothetical protein
MGDPVSERAHYVLAVESGAPAALFLIQEGRLEPPGVVPVVWRPVNMWTTGTRLRRALDRARTALSFVGV